MAKYAVRPILLALTVFAGAMAISCDDDDDTSVVRQETVQHYPDTIPGDEPLANDIPELVTEHLETEFGEEDWVDDVGEIERDGGTVRVTLERDFESDQQAFDELCTAVAAELMSEEDLGVREVIVAGEEGEDVMRTEGSQPQCAPLAT